MKLKKRLIFAWIKSKTNRRIEKKVFSNPEDTKSAILTVHPGAGGTESCDWASMLLRMYLKYFEQKGLGYRVLDLNQMKKPELKMR